MKCFRRYRYLAPLSIMLILCYIHELLVFDFKEFYHDDPWGSHGPRHTQQKSACQQNNTRTIYTNNAFIIHFGRSYCKNIFDK